VAHLTASMAPNFTTFTCPQKYGMAAWGAIWPPLRTTDLNYCFEVTLHQEHALLCTERRVVTACNEHCAYEFRQIGPRLLTHDIINIPNTGFSFRKYYSVYSIHFNTCQHCQKLVTILNQKKNIYVGLLCY
jgi:hypothetical protein